MKKQFLIYCIVGSIGGLFEIFLFETFNNLLNGKYIIANILSFIISVIYLYFANSKLVYKTKFTSKKHKIRKFLIFLATRVLGLAFDTLILGLCINIIGLSSLISKIISCISSTIINYGVGKYIFK